MCVCALCPAILKIVHKVIHIKLCRCHIFLLFDKVIFLSLTFCVCSKKLYLLSCSVVYSWSAISAPFAPSTSKIQNLIFGYQVAVTLQSPPSWPVCAVATASCTWLLWGAEVESWHLCFAALMSAMSGWWLQQLWWCTGIKSRGQQQNHKKKTADLHENNACIENMGSSRLCHRRMNTLNIWLKIGAPYVADKKSSWDRLKSWFISFCK